jgi:hypothetical protein
MTPDDEFDEVDMEEWMAMSEEERDQELASVMRDHVEWWQTLTLAEQFAERRRRAVESCAGWRRLIQDNPNLAELFGENLRAVQKRLVALRFERRTDIAPGSA